MLPEVQPVGADAEDAHAAHAVERLQDDVAVLGVEALDVAFVARHQRRPDELRKLEDRELLRVVAQRARLVEDTRAFALGLLEQVRRVEVLAVERRVLAHHDGAEIGQRHRRRLAGREPVARVAGQRDLAHVGGDAAAALPGQVLRLADEQRVAARGGLAHHREGRVLGDLEVFQRIGDEQQFHGGHPGHQISTFEPSSTTRFVGRFRKSAAADALRCMPANSFSRHIAMPAPRVGITMSRDRK